MDYNISLGKQMLPLVVQVLKYCTCPQLRPNFQEAPRCSLWALRPHIRQMWLKALLVILYKVYNVLILLYIKAHYLLFFSDFFNFELVFQLKLNVQVK